MSYLPIPHSSTAKAAAPINFLNGYIPAIDLPLHTNMLPRQFGRPSPASEDIHASGMAVPPDPISSHTNPILIARTAQSINGQDRRLDVFDTVLFKGQITRALWNNPGAGQYLATIYHDGQGAQPGQTQADHWVHQAAAQGHAGAQCLLGFMLATGVGIPCNDQEAFKWFQKAARQGDAAGQVHLGMMYFKGKGKGVERNYDEAFKWFQKAAGQGDAAGQICLGAMYFKGKGVEKNYVEAIQWYQKAAGQGNAAGQTCLGAMYFKGKGVEKNYVEAIQWYQKAAGQGNVAGQAYLGRMYFRGQGVEKNYVEAFQWYQKAAEQGHAFAQSMLAKLYSNGYGVEKNDKLALYWLLNSGLSEDGNTIVSKVYIPAQAIKFLPELFAKTPEWHRVRTLQLAYLDHHDQTASSLAQLISENQTLEVLDLRGSAFDELGAASFAKALHANLTLKELHLDGTAGSGPALADIATSLESNKNIAALTEAAQERPFQEASMDRIPADVIRLVEQATIVADQKVGEASRTYKQTQELVNEMRLAFAHQFLNDSY